MIILRESDYVQVPWKNGGGVTREILRAPPESTSFDWRLSLATIDAPGPFSAFDGYQRTLLLVRGAGVELNFGAHGRVRLDVPGKSAFFDGGWPTSCTLVDGPSTDLNLIVSPERIEARTSSLHLQAPQTIQTAGWQETLLCCISGPVRVTNSAGDTVELGSVDVARCAPADGPVTCVPAAGPARLFVAYIKLRKA